MDRSSEGQECFGDFSIFSCLWTRASIPTESQNSILKFMSGYAKDADKVQIRLMNLLDMDEKWTTALEHMDKHQFVVKRWFDKRATIKSFKIFDLFLLWD